MERRRQLQQTFTNEKEEKPGDQDSAGALGKAQESHKCGTPGERRARQFFQTKSADHAVVMFGDALAAEVLSALRAARHGLAHGMVETTLLGQILHGSTRFEFRK